MKDKLNEYLDRLSEFLAYRKGLIPTIGIFFILLNWLFQIMFRTLWLAETNFFLHLGVIIAILGFMVAWAL